MMEITARVLVNVDRCMDCRSCFAACMAGHHGEPIVQYGREDGLAWPIMCRHCDEPACAAACPYDAIEKDEHGIVRRATGLCRACGSCAVACPFGSMHQTPVGHRAAKCDVCVDRTALEGLPRCVEACPAGALVFAEVAEEHLEMQGMHVIGGRTLGHDPWRRR